MKVQHSDEALLVSSFARAHTEMSQQFLMDMNKIQVYLTTHSFGRFDVNGWGGLNY